MSVLHGTLLEGFSILVFIFVGSFENISWAKKRKKEKRCGNVQKVTGVCIKRAKVTIKWK